MKAVLAAGGSVRPYADDARAALDAENAKLLDAQRTNPAFEDGDAFVERIGSATAEWESVIGDLGYEDVSYDDFAAWYTPESVDLSDYSTKVYETIFLPHRPS